MSRRPKLIEGRLYYLKIKQAWLKKTFEYIARVINFEPTNKDWQGPPSIWANVEILASTSTDVDQWKQRLIVEQLERHPLDSSGDPNYYWHKAVSITICQRNVWNEEVVIQYYNPKNIPLYLNWPYGKDWLSNQLKGT